LELKREEMPGDQRRLYNKELHNLYTLQTTIRMIKSRMMRVVGQIVCMGKMRNLYRILVCKPEGSSHLKT